MKIKKHILVLTAVFFLIATANLASATSFITAKVMKTRTVNGTASVMLQYVSGSGCTWGNTNNTNIWFTVPSSMNDQSLAITLTAISLSMDVRVGIETCPNAQSTGGTLSSIGLEI